MGLPHQLRRLVRMPVCYLWTTFMFILRFAVLPTSLVAPRFDRNVRRVLVKIWARGVAWIVGMRIEERGPRPKAPYVLVCNHLTYMDIFVLAARLGSVFVARADVATWPVIGYMARQINIIFIDRDSRRDTVRVNKIIQDALDLGEGIVIFPEGGTSEGRGILPFRSPLLQPAIAAGMPIHHATLSYERLPGCPPSSVYVGWHLPGQTFTTHALILAAYPGFIAHLTFGDSPCTGTDRKALAAELHEKVSQNFVPLSHPEDDT